MFFGNAFIVRDKDHVAFDIFYLMAPNRLRRVLALISVAANAWLRASAQQIDAD